MNLHGRSHHRIHSLHRRSGALKVTRVLSDHDSHQTMGSPASQTTRMMGDQVCSWDIFLRSHRDQRGERSPETSYTGCFRFWSFSDESRTTCRGTGVRSRYVRVWTTFYDWTLSRTTPFTKELGYILKRWSLDD